MCQAQRHGRSPGRIGHYSRKLHAEAGDVELKVPRLRRQTFEAAIIERYRRRESIEESLVDMYAGVSARHIEDVTEALWGCVYLHVRSASSKWKIYKKLQAWCNESIVGEFPCVRRQ